MGDFRARLFYEFSELLKRIEKVKAFIASDKYNALPEFDRKDLKEQLKHMEAYHKVLFKRMHRHKYCDSS